MDINELDREVELRRLSASALRLRESVNGELCDRCGAHHKTANHESKLKEASVRAELEKIQRKEAVDVFESLMGNRDAAKAAVRGRAYYS